MPGMIRDTWIRSSAKAVSWRLTGSVTTSVLIFLFTRRLDWAIGIGSLELVAKIALYVLHERLWDRIHLGRKSLRPSVIWLTGLTGSGKSTLAAALQRELEGRGFKVERLDGEAVRDLFPPTGFTREDRDFHVKRVGHLASKLESHGVFVIASLVSPYREARDFVRGMCQQFIEVHVATPLEFCEARDSRNLYARARAGEIHHLAGVDDPYEAPLAPELVVDTSKDTSEQCLSGVMRLVERNL